MAEDNKVTNLNSSKSNTYTKGLNKDFNDSYLPEGVWTNAINAVTNSHLGDAGTIGNEPSNQFCTDTNFDIIGLIRRDADSWVVFSTNDVTSEIGIFYENSCEYNNLISTTCLGFKRSNLITGVVQANYDCTYTVFFADGLNPDRAINLDRIPLMIEKYTGTAECPIPVYFDPPRLDCDKTRLHYLIQTPCFELVKSNSAGTLFNGSYQVAIAYSINGQRVTDYFTVSNTVSIWSHENNGGSLDLRFSVLDDNFGEYEVVLISTINEITSAKLVGHYSTTQFDVHLDNNTDALIRVPLEDIPINQVIYETSDKMFLLNGYLLRTGLRTHFDFNYQPLANQIVTKWVQVAYPADYYVKGNNNTGYLRDEIYSYFIRWVYKTGDKSASYHIPGRPAVTTPVNDLQSVGGLDVLSYDNNGAATAPRWRVYNTGFTSGGSGVLPDGGVVTNAGFMSYWESSEQYPNKPNIWNASFYPWSQITGNRPYRNTVAADYDLCGKPIRHHKFPDDGIAPIYDNTTQRILLMGVQFSNIKPPVDENGDVIRSIAGYEILRGSREGNKTIIAKGLINNMYEYNVPNQTGVKALYQNYPYNSLEADYYLYQNAWFTPSGPGSYDSTKFPMTAYKKDYFTFHSPDFNFRGTYLNPNEVRIYSQYSGTSNGTFAQPYGHPKHKIPSQGAFLGCLLIGLGGALMALTGKKTTVKGNYLSLSGQTATTAASQRAGGAGPAAMRAANLLGGTAWSGGNIKGQIYGDFGGMSYPTISSEGNEVNIFNPTQRKPGVLNEFLAFVQQMNLIFSIGGFLLAQGFGNAMKAFMELLPWRQYALQYNSHGLYSKSSAPVIGNYRRQVNTARYLSSAVQAFDSKYLVNNLYRPNAVMLNTKNTFNDPTIKDTSRKTVGQLKWWKNPSQNLIAPISSYYAGFKVDFKGVYGQIESIVQLPISTCVEPITSTKGKVYTTPIYFNGDIYINRYTEKNKFPLFNQWLFDLPNGTDFDYKLYANVPYPRYWATFEDIDFNDIRIKTVPPDSSGFPRLSLNPIKFFKNFTNSFKSFITNPAKAITSWVYGPSALVHLDRDPSSYSVNLSNILKSTFYIKNGYFYLFVNGVRDFYCESEINLAYRDYGTLITEKFYDPYGYNNLYDLFRTDLISVPEFYKYDFSLSVSKLAASYISWGSVLSKSYNPDDDATCFQYYKKRLIYSLQQQLEQSRDNWRIYLPNNYKDFENTINNIKPINRTGSLMLFEDAIPTTINGVDELRTSAGNRITIGDAGLFNQPFQSLVNSDLELEYGSSQSVRGAVNTPYGVFWISQKNGKMMHLASNQITDISMNGMRYWFAENLKYSLLASFPNYALTDNPVKGIGCHTVYDSQYELIYFTKVDYKLLPGLEIGPTKDIYYSPQNKAFIVTSYSYQFKLTYGTPGADIQNGTKFLGTVNGQILDVCTYAQTNPTTAGIRNFINCIVNSISEAPNIKKVSFTTSDGSFKIFIDLLDPKQEATLSLFTQLQGLGIDPEPIVVEETSTKLIDPSDTNYFENCSWTVSYDPKIKMWVSFHDWHPDLMMSTHDHFFTIKGNSIWKHNVLCNSYGNYYNVNYGWEIEFPVNTGTDVTSIKSVEYYLEVFTYNISCIDRYHVLDGNFDQALIYNTEQTSGLLNLHIKPKNNPVALLNYPNITPSGIDIHVAKEENKYRFNQFWDATRDRGEFNGLQITNFITSCNGYRKNLNPVAVNYFKSPLQRKKFRHYGNRVILRKLQSGAYKMNLKVVTTKETMSPR